MSRYRASRHFELKQLAELSPEQRESFVELEADPDFYGLLIPRPPLTTNIKSVARQTAALFRKLSKPSEVDDDVVDLVLDGILEVKHRNRYVSGADALPIFGSKLPAAEPRDAIARLSRDALLHAQDLETSDATALTSALYFYNRIPLSPFWKTRFADGAAILAHLGADRGSLRALLARKWTASDGMHGWLSWQPKTRSRRDAAGITYKLYISPRPERMRDAFDVVVRVLADFPGTPFKIGSGAIGLLRPDKFVAYFATRALLDDAADALRGELAGCDAHGVPFTAGLDERGLLSWGIDPPDSERVLQWMARDSWRFWIAQRLGSALAIAKTAHRANAVEPWRFAIERVRRFGVDVETWTPSATLWSRS
jgi:hypothetical protein